MKDADVIPMMSRSPARERRDGSTPSREALPPPQAAQEPGFSLIKIAATDGGKVFRAIDGIAAGGAAHALVHAGLPADRIFRMPQRTPDVPGSA